MEVDEPVSWEILPWKLDSVDFSDKLWIVEDPEFDKFTLYMQLENKIWILVVDNNSRYFGLKNMNIMHNFKLFNHFLYDFRDYRTYELNYDISDNLKNVFIHGKDLCAVNESGMLLKMVINTRDNSLNAGWIEVGKLSKSLLQVTGQCCPKS